MVKRNAANLEQSFAILTWWGGFSTTTSTGVLSTTSFPVLVGPVADTNASTSDCLLAYATDVDLWATKRTESCN